MRFISCSKIPNLNSNEFRVRTASSYREFVPRDWYREWYGNGHIAVVYPGYFSIDMVSPFLDVVELLISGWVWLR